MKRKSKGQIAYEAWSNYLCHPRTLFTGLSEFERKAWHAAARATLKSAKPPKNTDSGKAVKSGFVGKWKIVTKSAKPSRKSSDL